MSNSCCVINMRCEHIIDWSADVRTSPLIRHDLDERSLSRTSMHRFGMVPSLVDDRGSNCKTVRSMMFVEGLKPATDDEPSINSEKIQLFKKLWINARNREKSDNYQTSRQRSAATIISVEFVSNECIMTLNVDVVLKRRYIFIT